MANLPTNLGQINLLAASVTFPNNTALNVTAQCLAKQGIRLAPEGDVTKFLEVLTGAVPSPQPYQMMTVTIALVKTLPLAAVFQSQFQSNAVVGGFTVRPDVQRGTGGLQPFKVINGSLMTMGEMDFGGGDAAYVVMAKGYWQVNAALWAGLAAASS